MAWQANNLFKIITMRDDDTDFASELGEKVESTRGKEIIVDWARATMRPTVYPWFARIPHTTRHPTNFVYDLDRE